MLGYRQNGYGLGYSYDDVMSMPMTDVETLLEMQDDAFKKAAATNKTKT